MLRVISFLFLLIISQASFAETIAATASTQAASALAACKAITAADIKTNFGVTPISFSTSVSSIPNSSQVSCNVTFVWQEYATSTRTSSYSLVRSYSTVYTCPSGYYQSDAAGTASTSAAYCTKSKTVCTDSAGLVFSLWVSATNPPSSGCYAGCTVSAPVTAGFPDRVGEYIHLSYTMKDEVCTGSGSMSYVDDATATAANDAAAAAKAAAEQAAADAAAKAAADAAADAAAKAAADAAALEAAKAACGDSGYTTGTVDGKTVVACKVPDSPTDTASSSSSTDTASSATSTSSTTNSSSSSTDSSGSNTNSGTSSSTSSGSNTGAATDTGTNDTSTDTEEEEESGDGGTSFSEPGEGTDYLKDVFGDSDLSTLKSENEALKKQITQKMSDVKTVFNLGSLAVAGNISPNTKQIKGSEVDLSGKNLFDQLSVLAAIFYLCAIAGAIYIVLGGKK